LQAMNANMDELKLYNDKKNDEIIDVEKHLDQKQNKLFKDYYLARLKR